MDTIWNSNGTTLTFWSAIVLISLGPFVVHFWWKIRRDEVDAALKQDMLARGMSVDEIERVLNAGRGGSGDEDDD